MDILGLDIGGAFIKSTYIPLSGPLRRDILPFPLYRTPEKLRSALHKIKPRGDRFTTAITMTGELCDSFPDRKSGVSHIVSGAVETFGSGLKVFARNGEFLTPSRAVRNWEEVASANWAAPPLLLARYIDDFLFVDIGSTTTDIVPVRKGKLACRGMDDHSRLIHRELLYMGYLRTPVQSVAPYFTIDGKRVTSVPEYFAVMGDVYLALGLIDRASYLIETPDGGPKTERGALARLARVVLSEYAALGRGKLLRMAKEAAGNQSRTITKAVSRQRLPVVLAGRGRFIMDAADGIDFIGYSTLKLPKGFKGDIDPSCAVAMLYGM